MVPLFSSATLTLITETPLSRGRDLNAKAFSVISLRLHLSKDNLPDEIIPAVLNVYSVVPRRLMSRPRGLSDSATSLMRICRSISATSEAACSSCSRTSVSTAFKTLRAKSSDFSSVESSISMRCPLRFLRSMLSKVITLESLSRASRTFSSISVFFTSMNSA